MMGTMQLPEHEFFGILAYYSGASESEIRAAYERGERVGSLVLGFAQKPTGETE